MWRATLRHQYAGYKIHGGLDKFYQMEQEVRDSYNLVGGHSPYGRHNLFTKPCVYIVTLREPIDRTLSHYYYLLTRPTHRIYPTVSSMSMKEYFARPNAYYDLGNIQTKFLSGNYNRIGVWGPQHAPQDDPDMPMEEVLERAKANLSTCMIGLQEHLLHSSIYFSKVLGWKQSINEGADRKNYDRPLFEDEPQWVLDMVAEHNQYDIKLYELACNLWEEQLDSEKKVEDYYVYPSGEH